MTLREQAYQTFTKQLLLKHIVPGQFVSQRELVELTGMPLGAIREMVLRLEADGLLRPVASRGLQILQVNVGLIRNAFQLRTILEREALKNFVAVVSDGEIAELRRHHLEAREAAQGAITETLLSATQQMDWDMHDRMIDLLDNALISDIYRINSIKIRLIRNEDTRLLPQLITSVMDEHIGIIDAVASRDADKADAALLMHLNSARHRAVRM